MMAALDYFGFDFKQKKQSQAYVEARRIVAAIMREHTTLSAERIAGFLNITSGAVFIGIETLYEVMEYDKRISEEYEELKQIINEMS